MRMTIRRPALAKFHSIKTVAERLSLSERTVKRLISTGVLQAVKIGGSVRVAEDEVQRLLAASRIV